jgi:hypothetical protein
MPHEYNKHHIEERHPTMDEHKRKTQTTSTLLAQAANQEPIPRSKKKQKKNSKTSKHRSHVMIITLRVPATIVVVIYEP